MTTEIHPAAAAPATRMTALLFSGVVDALGLKRRVGTSEYAQLLARHDEIVREVLADLGAGEIVRDGGDELVVQYGSTRDAIEAALWFQHRIADAPWGDEPLRVHIGVHVGEVAQMGGEGNGRRKTVGIAADVAARLMRLGLPGQILMTRIGFDDGRQYLREYPIDVGGNGANAQERPELQWMAHGPYLMDGTDEPIDVYEVGGVGIAPLAAPVDTESARRAVPPGEEEMYGWRPAIGLSIPRRTHWVLERPLGEGGFGEVWLAKHERTGSRRVYKFCFDAERAVSFKRELTLFKLLRKALGDRPDIATLLDIQFETPPFYLESAFTSDGDLKDWAERQGGIANVPLDTRIDLAARACDAVAAAHSVGILHKDLKPSNILIYRGEDGAPRPQLADFGIGEILDRSRLQQHDITIGDFTESLTASGSASRTGTRIYAPPESLVGRPFTIQGDVYALGVILYQLVVGDLDRPLAQGWERDVDDDLLREDIAACVAGRVEDRLPSAAHLAERLRSRERRRCLRRRRRGARVAIVASAVLAVLLVVAGGLVIRERTLRTRVSDERDRARIAQRESERQEAVAIASRRFLEDMLTAADPWRGVAETGSPRQARVVDLLDAAGARIETRFAGQPQAEATARMTLAETYYELGEREAAGRHAERALTLREAELGADHAETLAAMRLVARTREARGRPAEAEPAYVAALDGRRRTLGDEHPDTLQSMHDLACFLRSIGRHDEAEPLTKETLAKRERLLGRDDERTLDTREALAVLYVRTGRYDEAEAIYLETLDARTRLHGEAHGGTMWTTSALGEVYVFQGRYADAEPLFLRALELTTEALGEDHPTALQRAVAVAELYRSWERLDEAEPMYLSLLERQRRVLGPEHQATLATQNNLANLYSISDRHDESEPLLREVVEINRRVLGDEHPDSMMSMSNLALVYEAQDRLDEAESLQFEAYQLRLRALGPDNPYTHGSMSLMGEVYRKQRRLEDSERMHKRAIAGIRRSLAPGHWYAGVLLGSYGRLLCDLERYEDAETTLLEAHEYVHAAFGDDHRRSRAIAETLVDVYEKLGRGDEAAVWWSRLDDRADDE